MDILEVKMKRSVGKITYDDQGGDAYLTLNDHFLSEDTLMVADVLQDLVYAIGNAYAKSVENCDVLGAPGRKYKFNFSVLEDDERN